MPQFQFQKTPVPDLTLITPFLASDSRGYLSKLFAESVFTAQGISFTPVEELESSSCRNTLRGMHFQRRHSQDKLVRVMYGEVYDVALDLRRESPTFGHWAGFRLSSENRQMLYIPKNFAHGFLVLSDRAVLHYLCGDRYDPDSEDGIRWDDPDLAIDWPLEEGCRPVLSPRDQEFPSFAAFRASMEG